MAVVTKTFTACIGGRVYPKKFIKGDEVTGEAEKIGREMGCVEGSEDEVSDDEIKTKANGGAPENKVAGPSGKSSR